VSEPADKQKAPWTTWEIILAVVWSLVVLVAGAIVKASR
jgi:hypothetical protein